MSSVFSMFASVCEGVAWLLPAVGCSIERLSLGEQGVGEYGTMLVRLTMPRSLPQAILRVIGSGGLEEPLSRLVTRLGLTDAVDMPGALYGDALALAVRGMDVLALPSVREEAETFGVVLAEAQLMGVPAIAMGLGGPLDALHHGEGGFHAPAPSPLLLALQLHAGLGSRGGASHGSAARHDVQVHSWP